jgi:DNA-binding MarR family transcriptional regulator
MPETENRYGFYERPKVDWNTVPEGLRDMYNRPGFLVRRCHQIATSIFYELCEPLTITPSQYMVLYAVDAVPGVTQIDVAKILGLDRSTTGSVINRLEENGLLVKTVFPSDRRKHSLRLTENGRCTLESARMLAKQVTDGFLAPLKPEEREKFISYMRTIMQAHGEIVRAPLGFDKP